MVRVDWSKMPKDIVAKIVEHLDFYEDFETILKVCSPWRSAAKEAKFRGACNNGIESHTLPWLLLPERDESTNIRRLYSVSKNMVRHIRLPTLDDESNKTRLLSSRGWLLLVSELGNKLALYSPYSSRAIIELPEIKIKLFSLRTVDYRNYNNWHNVAISKFTLSADPLTTSNFVVFLSCMDFTQSPPSILIYWRNGDEKWTQITHPSLLPELGPPPRWFVIQTMGSVEGFLGVRCRDLTFYQGEFYGVNDCGLVVKFSTSSQGNSFQEVAKFPLGYTPPDHNHTTIGASGSGSGSRSDDKQLWLYHLVESVGKLLVIRHVRKYGEWSKIKYQKCDIRFEVLELDVSNGGVKDVQTLGNQAIFIGLNSSFSATVDVYSHGFEPSCIYLTDDAGDLFCNGIPRRGKNHCVYNLNKRKFQRIFYHGPSSHIGKLTRLMWFESPKLV